MRPFRDSTALRDDGSALRARMEADGYLFIRGLLPTAAVEDLRRQFLEIAARHGWLRADTSIDESVADPAAACVDPEPRYLTALREIYRLEAFHALSHHPAILGLLETMLDGPVLPHPRLIARSIFPQRPDFTTPAHQDFPHIQGTPDTYSVWIPLGDCPIERGGLQIAEGSHRSEVMPFRVTSGSGGMEVIEPFEGRWVASDFATGDAVIFHSMTVHKALPNTSIHLRQSVDSRYQRADQPLVEASLRPYAEILPWEEIYAGWSSTAYQYYWTRRPLTLAPFDSRWYEQRDALAFEMAEQGQREARATLLRIVQRDADPAKRDRAAALLRRLDATAPAA